MMNIEAITQIIGTVGFPIFAACYMMYINQELRKSIDSLSDTLLVIRTYVEQQIGRGEDYGIFSKNDSPAEE